MPNDDLRFNLIADIGELEFIDPAIVALLNSARSTSFTTNFANDTVSPMLFNLLVPEVTTGLSELNLKLHILGKVTTKYSGVLQEFDAEVNGHVESARLWFPITDRRLARRIARKERCRFRKRGRRDYEILT